MSNRRRWGVQLVGYPYDLADWAQQLTSFDPWVHKSNDGFVLRWSGFDELNTAHEVYEAAAFIVDQLNGGHCHVNRKFADQMTMAVTVHAATVAWRHVSIA